MKSFAVIAAFVVFLMFAVCTPPGFGIARAAEIAEAPGPVRDLAFADDTGASAADGITNDSELVFTWTEPDGGGAVGYEYQLNGVVWVAVTPATVALSPGEGAHTLEVRAVNALEEPGDAVSINVTVDVTGPVVVSHSPSGQVLLPVASVDVTFNEPIDAATFDVSDLAISGPDGAITPDSVTDQGNDTFRIAFPVQTVNGAYSVLVGPGIDDLAGNTMDQDTSGTGGENPADVYDASFTLAIPAEEVELNDARVTANMLPLAEDPTDSGFIMGLAIGTIDPANANDWWSDPDYWGFVALGGDVVTLTVNAPHSDLNPYVELRDGSDTHLTSDDGGGPGSRDSLTPTYTIPTSGIYYVRIGKYYYSAVPGLYELRVDIARGIQLENDRSYSNDSIGGANGLTFETAGTERNATIAGTMMSSGDVDRFALRRMNPGETVSLDLRLPSVSTLDGRVVLVDSSGTPVADDDGDATDGDFAATIAIDGNYYAQVQANSGSGTLGRYVLDVTRSDGIPPKVTSVTRIPAEGGTTAEMLGSLTVNISEDMDASTVNAFNPYGRAYNGNYYFVTESSMSWTAAETYAQLIGGHLVTIDDQAEQDFVQKWFCNYGPWIGLTDVALNGTWLWASGDAVAYTNWASGEPNSSSYDYARMNGWGTWEDRHVTHAHYGLIELPAPTDGDGDGVPDAIDVAPADPLNTWDLRSDGGDGTFDNGDDVIYNLVLSSSYSSGLSLGMIVVRDGPLPDGHYRLTVNSSMKDTVGNTLDGNGDLIGGDPYQRTFYVSTVYSVPLESPSNNAIGQAAPLTLAEDPAASGYFSARVLGSQDPTTSNNWWSDPDYYSFEALAGDLVSVSVDTPENSVDPYVQLRNASDANLIADDNSGPKTDAFISHYTIPSDGTYYLTVGKYYYNTTPGNYLLRLDVARGIQMESDLQYNNDGTSGADPVTLTTAGTHRTATVVGTVMESESTNLDEDTFLLGVLSTGMTVQVSTRLPSTSILMPRVQILDSTGAAVSDDDSNSEDGAATITVPADGSYYARVDNPVWWYGGHIYRLTQGTMTPADAETEAAGSGHLATIDDAAEQAWVHKWFGGSNLWIGMNDALLEGTWEWTSGDAVTYTNWASAEPNSGSSYDWAYIHSGNGLWYDGYNTWNYWGLIEIPGAGSPDEAGAGPFGQYLLDVDVADLVPPRVNSLTRIPANGGTTDLVIGSFNVNLSEDLDPATVNATNPFVGQYNGHHYVLTPSTMTWADAETYAQGLLGNLATIDDQAEQDFVERWFAGYSPWIGLNDVGTEGTWVWSSEDEVTYTNWAATDPNTASYDAAYMDGYGLWYDSYTTSTRWGLVEVPVATDNDGDGIPDNLDAHPGDSLNAWELRSDGGDAVFDTIDDVVYTIRPTSTYSAGTSINFTILDGPLAEGSYRFTANTTLTDMVGNVIDGDADGTGGDKYEHFFTVAGRPGFVFEGRMNNSAAAAAALALVEDPPVSGHFIASGYGSLDPYVSSDSWGDSDVFKFEAQAGDKVSVSTDTPVSDVNPYTYIYNATTNLRSANDEGPYNDDYI
ncbi:MAG: pre-peptidase C-terminal domain-containing protein, partial [Planctomycetes bacterium]|nr:pre-peptidase C-terminal domain-containing protein [Planctomycetota bacterium]